MSLLKGKVKARVVRARDISLVSRRKMYSIFEIYYDGVSWNGFQKDLDEKDDVILLEHAVDGICGFSTLQCKRIQAEGKEVIGIFSGDTILERKYWGSPALGIKFLAYLWTLKLKNPTTDVYWFLISKGYKTYLLMANNFTHAFPDYQKPTPAFEKSLMDKFYSEKYPAHYRPDANTIVFDGVETARLKNQVAPIVSSMRTPGSRIAFFEQINPGWQNGDELACIARMSFTMPVRYALKKCFRRNRLRNEGHADAPARLTTPARSSRVL